MSYPVFVNTIAQEYSSLIAKYPALFDAGHWSNHRFLRDGERTWAVSLIGLFFAFAASASEPIVGVIIGLPFVTWIVLNALSDRCIDNSKRDLLAELTVHDRRHMAKLLRDFHLQEQVAPYVEEYSGLLVDECSQAALRVLSDDDTYAWWGVEWALSSRKYIGLSCGLERIPDDLASNDRQNVINEKNEALKQELAGL